MPLHVGRGDHVADRGLVLTDTQLDRYARHIVLKEVGGAGQQRLLASTVAVVGAGGLGSACLPSLAAAGVGCIRLIDDDRVTFSNLQRQTLYTTEDVGAPKAERAATALTALNPDVTVEPLATRLTPDNAADLLAGADAIADGSDNFATRLAVADTALGLRIPLIAASVGPMDGQLATFRGWEPRLPCYRCLVGSDPSLPQRSCADEGVLGALPLAMGALQALEVIRELTPFGEGLAGRLLLYDALTSRMRTLTLPKDPGCPACSRYSTASPE